MESKRWVKTCKRYSPSSMRIKSRFLVNMCQQQNFNNFKWWYSTRLRWTISYWLFSKLCFWRRQGIKDSKLHSGFASEVSNALQLHLNHSNVIPPILWGMDLWFLGKMTQCHCNFCNKKAAGHLWNKFFINYNGTLSAKQ